MEHNLLDLRKRVVDQLRPPYQRLLQRGQESDEAYAATYEKAVTSLAKTMKVSREKTKFESRTLLQEIMNEVTR